MADELTPATPRTCATCQHWFKQPLQLEPVGECRGGPPTLLVLPKGADALGRPVMQVQTTYVPVPGNFPACGQYQAKVEVASVHEG